MSAPPSFLGQVFTRKLFAFAGYTLLIYDYFLTLSLEVKFIWNEPWTLVKSLFLINRYGNLIGQTFIMLEETGYLSHGSRRFCIAFQVYAPFFSVFSGESIRLFVVMRACAILRCRRKVALLANTLYVLFAIGVCVMSVYLALLYVNASDFLYLEEVGLCVAPVAVPTLWLVWFIPLVADGTLLVLICSSLYRSAGESYGASSRLIRLLARDAFLFYFAALFGVLFSMICWNVYSQDPRNFLQTLLPYPILSVVGQRLVLNLRKYGSRADSTHDLSWEVNRQIAAMGDLELVQLGTEPAQE